MNRRRSPPTRRLGRRLLVAALTLSAATLSSAAPERPTAAQVREIRWSDRASADIRRLMAEGRWSEALPLVERQLASRRRWRGAGSLETARSLDTLARIEYEQGLLERAYEHQREALRVREARLGKRHLEVAESVEQLGRILKGFGMASDDPMPLYRRALEIRLALQPAEHPDVAAVRMRIANLHRMRRQWADAEKNFRLALDARRKTLGADHPEVAVTLSEYALFLVAKGDWARAERLAREALVLQRRNPLRLMQDYTICLNLNAQILAHGGRFGTAESLLIESAAIREARRDEAPPGAGRSRMYQLVVYLELASVQLAQGKGDAAWASLERALGRVLEDALPSGPGARGGAPPAEGATPLAQVQRALAPDAALVGWFETRRGGGAATASRWGYVIRPRGPIRWERIDRDSAIEARFFKSAPRYRRELNAAGAWPLRVTDDGGLRTLARGYAARELDPLMRHLGGVRRLVVVSPDVLAGVPVESWIDAQGRYLVERFAVSYAPSAAWYVRLRSRDPHRPADRWNALLIGDPALSRETTLGAQAVARAEFDAWIASDLAGSSLMATRPEPPTLTPLPRARHEVERVSGLLPRATVLLGARASENEVDRLAASGALSRFDLIHFATHAVIDGRRPEKSALLLAGGASTAARTARESRGRAREGDGWLTAEEIRRTWKIDAELVSLSACRTALGLTTRAEGTLGLNQALLAAGAHSLLVSLWDVDDTAQALLAGRFYENLVGKTTGRAMSKIEALAEAKNWLRRQRDARGASPFAHPAYWAAFVLIGDPA